MKQLLVVDDDQEILNLLSSYLQKNQFQVHCAQNGQQAWQQVNSQTLDLIILDLMLPDTDGFSLCRQIRQQQQTPIIILTANADETDRIIGLELGADDYLSKPFNPRELLARIKAILRRTEQQAGQTASQLYFAGFSLDCQARTLCNPAGQTIALSGQEFALLQFLLQRAGSIVDRSQLLELTRGRDLGPLDRSLDVQISRLRSKLNDDGKQAKLIKTVRGLGYVLAAEVKHVAAD